MYYTILYMRVQGNAMGINACFFFIYIKKGNKESSISLTNWLMSFMNRTTINRFYEWMNKWMKRLSVYLSVYLFVCLSCLSMYLSIHLFMNKWINNYLNSSNEEEIALPLTQFNTAYSNSNSNSTLTRMRSIQVPGTKSNQINSA